MSQYSNPHTAVYKNNTLNISSEAAQDVARAFSVPATPAVHKETIELSAERTALVSNKFLEDAKAGVQFDLKFAVDDEDYIYWRGFFQQGMNELYAVHWLSPVRCVDISLHDDRALIVRVEE